MSRWPWSKPEPEPQSEVELNFECPCCKARVGLAFSILRRVDLSREGVAVKTTSCVPAAGRVMGKDSPAVVSRRDDDRPVPMMPTRRENA